MRKRELSKKKERKKKNEKREKKLKKRRKKEERKKRENRVMKLAVLITSSFPHFNRNSAHSHPDVWSQIL